MKKFTAMVLALVMVCALSSCTQKSDPKYYLTESVFERDGEIQKTTYAYNENWLITETVSFLNGEEEYRMISEYDAHGHLISNTIYEGGEIYQIVSYTNTYDENNNLIRADIIRDGETTLIVEMTYDTDGNMVTQKTDDLNDGNITETIFRPDGKLLSQKSILQFPDIGPVESTVSNTYDDKGLILESVNTFNNGEAISRTVSEYTLNDKLSKEIIYNDLTGDIEYYNAYTYEGNTETVTQHMANDRLVSTTIRTYDDAGNMIRSEYYDQNGTLQQAMTFTYICAG